MTNATLTITGGANIGLLYDYGIVNVDGSAVVSEGRPEAPNRFVDYGFVQEQPIRLTNGVATWPTIYPYHYGSTTTSFRSRFTEFIGHRTHIYQANQFRISSTTVEDCAFKLGSVSITHTSGTPTGLFRNNLWERSSLQVTADSDFSFYNNLFYRTGVSANNATLNSLTFKDNGFHHQGADNLDDVINDYNAYIDTSARLYPNGANDVILGSFNYASGTFGKYYHSSATLLNEGSRNATVAGLYHHTVQTSETKDASVVDVGFHYVAASGGLPVDTDSDGIPDYVEDIDGDGSLDTGETSYSTANEGASGLIVFTPLN